uniref:Uncharacterized protein n=1 Tax=Coptotermes formosanus TaxID=36987 RepID=R4V0F6_COPFO|nr:hypothetical protein [Coptotermes formosanus]
MGYQRRVHGRTAKINGNKMASKIICLLAVLCAMQVAHATSVQKRDALQDIINAALQPIALIQSQIEPIISQAQGLIQAVQTQIANVISSIIADLLAKANAVQAQIAVLAAIPGCAIGQAGNVTQIAIQAGQDLQAIAVNQLNPFLSKVADLVSIGLQAAKLFQDTQASLSSISILDLGAIANIPNVAANALSKGLLYVSSATADLVYLSTQLPIVPYRFPRF